MKNLRVERAYNTMKEFGINKDRVKPALKNLLKVFDKNWEFIEAENYRVLLDAIFDDNKYQKMQVKRKSFTLGESEPSGKKVFTVPPNEDEASSTQYYLNSTLVNMKDQNGEYSVMDKGRGTISCVETSPEKQVSERGSSSSSPKFQIEERGPVCLGDGKILMYCERSKQMIIEDDEQCDISLVPLGSSSKLISDMVEGSSTGNISKSSPLKPARKPRKTKRNFDITSRFSGEVKISFVSTLTQPTACRTPDIEAVLKSVEDKFMKSHYVIGPPFSLKNLLQQLCESFITRMATNNNSDIILVNEMDRPPRLYIDDITKGAEKVMIPLIDENGNRSQPNFSYIKSNLIYQKATVNISLARISDEDCCPKCSSNCLMSPVPCACARITNGEFAYSKDGILKEGFLIACMSEDRVVYCQDCPIERAKNEKKPDKCKGHNVKRFIKECWSKCGCSLQCGNRVVQRGITRKLQVYWTSEGKGWGLRTAEDLPKGAFVCEYAGEIVTNTELDERNNRRKGTEIHTYPIPLDADWSSESILDDDFALCLDATRYGNIGRFINHRCGDANMIDIPVEVETVDHHYYHIAFFTRREVKAYEELTWDYNLDFDDEDHPIKAFECRCGSGLCRNTAPKGSKVKGKAPVSTG